MAFGLNHSFNDDWYHMLSFSKQGKTTYFARVLQNFQHKKVFLPFCDYGLSFLLPLLLLISFFLLSLSHKFAFRWFLNILKVFGSFTKEKNHILNVFQSFLSFRNKLWKQLIWSAIIKFIKVQIRSSGWNRNLEKLKSS